MKSRLFCLSVFMQLVTSLGAGELSQKLEESGVKQQAGVSIRPIDRNDLREMVKNVFIKNDKIANFAKEYRDQNHWLRKTFFIMSRGYDAWSGAVNNCMEKAFRSYVERDWLIKTAFQTATQLGVSGDELEAIYYDTANKLNNGLVSENSGSFLLVHHIFNNTIKLDGKRYFRGDFYEK